VDADRPLIVAAGGDGTVGAVANYLAYTDAVLGIIPLGTSNDVARSLRLPVGIEEAAHVLATGKVATVDLGSFFAQGEEPRYFAHAAAMGIDVKFAKLATQVTLRRRLGRFTYAVAAVLALRDRQPFRCELRMGGRTLPLCLLHLSVINAPIFGGRFNLAIEGSDVDDRRLDVLAVEDAPLHHLLWATIPLLLRRRPHVGGVRLYHLQRLHVHIEQALDVSLDGEIAARIPGEFILAPEALRVVTTQAFVDVD
jgi:YegS/Rv2252/BmrU family lipid kinase